MFTKCNCKIRKVEGTRNPGVSPFETIEVIDYCPLHKAAPKLYEALKEIRRIATSDNFDSVVDRQVIAAKCYLVITEVEAGE